MHDTAAARICNILAALRDAGLIALADKGYHGYDPADQQVRILYNGSNKPESQKAANRAHASLRGTGERPTPNSKPGSSCANYGATDAAPARGQSHPCTPQPRDHCCDLPIRINAGLLLDAARPCDRTPQSPVNLLAQDKRLSWMRLSREIRRIAPCTSCVRHLRTESFVVPPPRGVMIERTAPYLSVSISVSSRCPSVRQRAERDRGRRTRWSRTIKKHHVIGRHRVRWIG